MKTMQLTSLLAVLLLLPARATVQTERQAETKSQDEKIDGNWTVVHVEIGGQKLPEKAVTGVTIKENVLRFSQEGKERAWKLDFGPKNALKAKEVGEPKVLKGGKDQPAVAQMYVGVYIASSEYLCFALNPWTTDVKQPKGIGEGSSQDEPAASGPQAEQPLRGDAVKHGPVGCDFLLILHRDMNPQRR
jgi:hypothetical protein